MLRKVCGQCSRSIALVVLLSFTSACGSKGVQVVDPTGLRRYVDQASNQPMEANGKEGSLWVADSYRSDLFRDLKARYVNDILTIRVVETTQAVASADAKNTKDTSVATGIDSLLGLEKKIKELPTLASGKGSSSFEGAGSTSRVTTLQTNLTARVTHVLPNGYLVVEGMREVRVNNENQNVYLTGVVRPEDITRENVVLSSAVGQMSVRVQGRGIVSQPINPGWLYKILNGVLPF